MTMATRTITQRFKRPIIFDQDAERELWETYHKMGKASSHDKLREWAQKKGMHNPRTGETSKMTTWFAMWRYAFRNPQEAYPHWEKWIKEYLSEANEEGIRTDFNTFLNEVKRVVQGNHIRGESKIRAWCKKWGVEY